MTPQKVMPFSLDAVRQICTIEPLKSVEACSICSRIKPHVSLFEKGDVVERNDIPPEARKLRFFLDYGPNVGVGYIAQCPECLRLYEYQDEYEYMVFEPSETSESFTRTTADRIVENPLWRYLGKPAELQFDGEAWQVVVDGQRNLWPWIVLAGVAKNSDKGAGKKPAADGEVANDRYNRGRYLMMTIEPELRARALDEPAKKVAAEAETEYKAALAIDSNHGRAHIMLGMLCQMTGRHAEAEPHLKYGMGLPRGSQDWHIAAVTLANSYLEQERAADAAKVLEEITSAGSNDVLVLYKLGLCYTYLGRADDAERVLRRGLSQSPEHPQLTQALAALGKSPDPAPDLPPEIAAKQRQAEKLTADMQEKMKAILDGGGSPESIQKKIEAATAEYRAAVTKLYSS